MLKHLEISAIIVLYNNDHFHNAAAVVVDDVYNVDDYYNL